MNLDNLPSDALIARIGELLGQERRTIVAFLFHLEEMDRRQLHLDLGFPSLFAYCTDGLRLSKAAAFRRTHAARLLRRFPIARRYLECGALCLTTFVELRDVLTDDNHEKVLADAAGKTEDEVRELVAALRPKPAPADLFRRLPTPTSVAGSGPEPNAASGPRPSDLPLPPPRIEPISEELRVLRVTVGRAFADDLRKVRALLGHKVPDGNLAQVLHECIRLTIAACEKRRRGGDRPSAPARNPKPRSRYIPAPVRRAVWERDGGRCAFVGATGRRCDDTHRVEFHHIQPSARGGPPTVDNVSLRCTVHNAYEADLAFGRAHMEAARGQPPTA